MIRKDGEVPLFDGLGSERTVTNSSQAVTATLTLAAFGQAVASSGSSTSPYQFGATSGYRSEGDAGLTLVGCRFYDAQVGRFITRDTYLDQKPYAYCYGDPVNCTDPSGHQPPPIWTPGPPNGWGQTPGGIYTPPGYEPPPIETAGPIVAEEGAGFWEAIGLGGLGDPAVWVVGIIVGVADHIISNPPTGPFTPPVLDESVPTGNRRLGYRAPAE